MYRSFAFLLIKSCLLIAALSIGKPSIQAQTSEGGTPPSFSSGHSLKSGTTPRVLPIDFDVKTLLREDSLDALTGVPMRLGIVIPASFDLMSDGQTQTLASGQDIQLLAIQAPNAIATMLYYDEFYIPDGGRLFIYNADKTSVLGAYTGSTNPLGKEFATELLPGDEFVMEYVFTSGNNKAEPPRIRIGGVMYGYNYLDRYKTGSLRVGYKDSGACEVNVNCPEGDTWQNHKKGVARIITRIGNGSYYCTGSLVNNTSGNVIPYFLTAYHCFNVSQSATASYSTMLFYFHYEMSGCETVGSEPASQTMTGAQLLAESDINGGSDGALLRLTQNIPESYDVFYNGWDNSSNAPLSGTGIHHPSGDVKKISTYTNRATSATWYGDNNSEGASGAHWKVIFSPTANGHGVTEGGSSGSPLFNTEGLIVGTLSGGSSECDNPYGINLYGKMWYHWDKSSQKMKQYLDPANTGVTNIKGRFNSAVNADFRTDRQSAYTGESISYRNTSYGGSQWAWSFPGGQPALSTEEHPTVLYNTAGNYEAVLTINPGTPQEMSKTLHNISISERPGTVIANSLRAAVDPDRANVAVLNWDIHPSANDITTPYTDTIRYDNGTPNHSMGMNSASTYSILSYWSKDDLKQYESIKIKDILMAVSNNTDSKNYTVTFKIKIYQDSKEIYSQNISQVTYDKYFRVALNTPFEVDLTKDLMFGYQAAQSAAGYPILLDTWPVVNNKNILHGGNDFVPFESLFEGTSNPDPGNFCLAAIAEVKQKPSYSFNVYRDNDRIVTNLHTTSYSDIFTAATDIEHCYQVSASYLANDTESGLSNTTCVTLDLSTEESLTLDSISIHPVPLRETLYIKTPSGLLSITVTDSKGTTVYHNEGRTAQLSVDTRSWASGVYIILIRTQNGQYKRKVVK